MCTFVIVSEKIPFKEINRLAIPAIFAGIAEPLIGIVDTGIVGHFETNSAVSQSAVGLGSSFYSIILWSLLQIRTSISAIVSQYVGKNKLQVIHTLIPQTLLFGVLLGLVFGGLGYYYAAGIFRNFYGVDAYKVELLDQTVAYFRIRAVGLPISMIVFICFGIFRGFQNTMWIMKASLVGALFNVVLDYTLVYGIGSFKPDMGIEGIAWASVIAQVCMMTVAIFFLKRKTPFPVLPSFKLNPVFGKMIAMSGNMILRSLSLNFVFYLANNYAEDYGKDYLAAHTIILQFWVFSFFFIDGYSNAGNALAGKLYGGNDLKRMKLLIRDLVKVNLLVAGILAGMFLIGYPFLGEVFSNKALVAQHFNEGFWVIIVAQFINSITFTYDGIFKGLGETAYLRNTLFIASFGIFWPALIFFDYLEFKILAIWFSFILWNSFRGATLIYKYRRVYNVEL